MAGIHTLMNRQLLIPCAVGLLWSSSACAQVYGDANGDGLVNTTDVATVARAASGLSTPSSQAIHMGDVAPVNNLNAGSFGDGKLNVSDAARISRYVTGLEPAPWPARTSAYMLEIGNTYTTRKYNASGAATTGPGTGKPDIDTRTDRVQQETVGTTTYNAYVLVGNDGSEQHLAPSTYLNNTTGLNEAAIVATQGTISGKSSSFDPPLVVLVEPIVAGTKWSGTTTPSALGSPAPYTGEITGPETVVVPAGTFTNAYKLTLKYSYSFIGFPGTGEEYVWVVPFLGPVQHGYTQSAPFSATKTVIPDIRLLNANVHGVLYP
jgi:hypothetical protein